MNTTTPDERNEKEGLAREPRELSIKELESIRELSSEELESIIGGYRPSEWEIMWRKIIRRIVDKDKLFM